MPMNPGERGEAKGWGKCCCCWMLLCVWLWLLCNGRNDGKRARACERAVERAGGEREREEERATGEHHDASAGPRRGEAVTPR